MSTIDPLARLQAERSLARSREDPCANLCTLANVDADGLPQARTVILRDLENRLAVFVNATSPKFAQLENGPLSIVIWLPSLNVQYRLAATTEPVPAALVAGSWQLRPDPPKRMDWLYTTRQAQSSPIASREALLDLLTGLELPEILSAPDTARGLYLQPSMIERLDLNQENGVHDRRRWVAGNPTWRETVLVP